MSVRLGTSGDRRFGHQVGRPHSVLCFSPHDACTAVCFQKLYLDRERYTVFWLYTICRPNTKTKRLAEHPHTRKLSVFFFLHVAIRNSLRSNNKSMPASTSRIKSPFCINTNQLSIFIILRPRPRTYPSTSPLLLLQLHQQQYLLSIINIINSTCLLYTSPSPRD